MVGQCSVGGGVVRLGNFKCSSELKGGTYEVPVVVLVGKC